MLSRIIKSSSQSTQARHLLTPGSRIHSRRDRRLAIAQRRESSSVPPHRTVGHGFTLLEVLVALAVLAIAMGAIIHAATQSINTTATLRDRTFAGWVARNQVNALLLETKPWPEEGSRAGNAELANRVWRWEARFYKTDDPDLRRLELTVRAGETGAELGKLVAFKGKPPEKSTATTGQPGTTDNPAPPTGQPPTPRQSRPAS